jgi:hypothetical protein
LRGKKVIEPGPLGIGRGAKRNCASKERQQTSFRNVEKIVKQLALIPSINAQQNWSVVSINGETNGQAELG